MLCLVPANAANRADIAAILNRLDSLIEVSPSIVARKEARLSQLKSQLRSARNDEARYALGQKLYAEYCSYKSDSAISTLQQCFHLAEKMHRPDLKNDCLSLIAYESSSVGHYPDAGAMLRQVDESNLSAQGKFYYYRAMNHLYSEIGFYSHLKSVRDSAYNVADKYEDLLLRSLDKRSATYKYYLCRNLYSHHKYPEALTVCNQWLAMTPRQSRDFAMVAYFQHLIHSVMGHDDDAIYWAACTAVSDVSHAVMDQGGLWMLVDRISKQDLNRSYRYIKFAWQCANTFGTDVRTKQIMPVLSVVESQYQQQLNVANQRLRIITLLIALLAVALVVLLGYFVKQRRKLAVANSRLTEADRIKEAYIGRFLTLCSDYINRMDKARRSANKLIKDGKTEELYHITRSTEERERNVEELYGYFDETFLKIFPTFVTDFNALLRPECRVEVEPGKLNTTLRIFALIRLGIDDSSKIAAFLHYSVNTIYNYRARTKNGCIADRDTFESRVKQLGKL